MANQGSQGNNGNSTRGGTSEQHAEAGRQSHKNDDSKGGNGDSSGGNSGNSTRGGTPEQHAKAGSQSHKNDK
jgi:uncharacterized protein